MPPSAANFSSAHHRQAVGQHLVLDLATEQVVGRLHCLHRQGPGELGHLWCVVVGHANVADLAFGDELPQGARRLGDRNLRVGPVHLVQVDVVDAQRCQAGVHALAQPLRARVADQAGIGHAQGALGSEHELVPVPGELIPKRFAEQSLGRAETVGVRGVEEVDAQLAGAADRRDGRVLIKPAPVSAKLPSTEGDAGNHESAPAQRGGLHVAVLLERN